MAAPTSETVVAYPSPALAPFVERYMGYRLLGFPAGIHRGLPSRRPTFILAIDQPIDVVEQTDPTQSPDRYRCVVGGLQASPAQIAHDGNQEGVSVDLTPTGFRALFGMPAAALWNTSVELGDLVRRTGDEMWERVQLARDWPRRFAVVDEVLTRLLGRSGTPRGRAAMPTAPELLRAWQLLDSTHGSVTVGELAAEVGWSRQHLRRRFNDEFGLSPKLAARVFRFDRARRAIVSAPAAATLGQLAAELGYFDQAHLNREFAELARCTPTELLAEELPSVQDEPVLSGRA